MPDSGRLVQIQIEELPNPTIGCFYAKQGRWSFEERNINMSKLYIARHRDFDMYWGRKCGKSMWINDISSATVMTKKQWKEFMKVNGIKEESVQLYERRYTND